MAEAYARLVVAARWWIVAFWAAGVLASFTLSPSFGDAGAGGNGLQGLLNTETPAVQTEFRDFKLFGFPLSSRTIVVQHDRDGLSPYVQARTVVRAVAVSRATSEPIRDLRGALPITNTRGLFPGAEEQSTTALTYLLFDPGASVSRRTRGAKMYADLYFAPRDHVVGVTGSAPARQLQGTIIRDALPLVEAMTLLAILGIVAIAFRSLVAPFVAVITAGVAYVATLQTTAAATALFEQARPDELEPVIVALLLGVVTDYVVFFCSSLRDAMTEEDPRTGPAAQTRERVRQTTAAAIARSGPIVAVAGTAVIVGTATLLVAESPFFRALGPALAFTVTIGLLVAVTLVPAILAIVGDRVFWPTRRRAPDQRGWRSLTQLRIPVWPTRVVGTIAGNRAVAAGVLATAVAVLAVGAAPIAHLSIGSSFVSSLPGDSSVRVAAASAQQGFAEGILSPTTVLLEGEHLDRQRQSLRRLGKALAGQQGVAGVLGPGSQPRAVERKILIARDGGAARFLVILSSDPLGATAVADVDRLQRRLPALLAESGLVHATFGLAGDSLTASFLVHQTESDLLRIAVAAIIANLLMLLLFLRAAFTSVLLLGTSVLSLSATLGITSVLFEWTTPGQGLTFYVPFAAAVLLLAFGSDYNIFTVGHVWEAADGRTLPAALRQAMPSSIGAVTTAGVALATSFGLLALVPLAPFYQLAFAVALGIALDVFVVRLLVVPALLTLLGRHAAWPSRRFRDPGLNNLPQNHWESRSS